MPPLISRVVVRENPYASALRNGPFIVSELVRHHCGLRSDLPTLPPNLTIESVIVSADEVRRAPGAWTSAILPTDRSWDQTVPSHWRRRSPAPYGLLPARRDPDGHPE